MGANETGIDIKTELLDLAAEEAKTALVDAMTWREGDVQYLHFEDESFDVVISNFGHMFASQADVVAKEMIRVTKKGGRYDSQLGHPNLRLDQCLK